MKRDHHCSDCCQKDTCRQAYEKLGKVVGPNVAPKVTIAFLLPILVFILSLVGAEKLLSSRFEGRLLTLFIFLSAFLVTFGFVLLIRVIRGPQQNNCDKR